LWKDLDLHQPSFGMAEAQQPQGASEGGAARRSLDLTAQTSRWVEKQRARNGPPGLSVASVAEVVDDHTLVKPDDVGLRSDSWAIIGGDTGDWLQGMVVRSHRFWPWWGMKLAGGGAEGGSRRDVAKELIVVAVWNLAGAFAKHPSLDPLDYVVPALVLASSLAHALCGVDHPLTLRIVAKLQKTATVAARGWGVNLPLALATLPESATPRKRRPATASASVSVRGMADRAGFAVQLSRIDASALRPVAHKPCGWRARSTPRSDSPTTVGSRPTTAQSLTTDRADTPELSRPASGSERRGRHGVGPLPNHSCVANGFRLLEPLRLCSDRSIDTGGPGIAAGTVVVGMQIGEWIRVTGIGPSAGEVGFVPSVLDGRSVTEPDDLPDDVRSREEEELRSRMARVQRLRLAPSSKVSLCTHSRTGMGDVCVGSVGAITAVLATGEVTVDFPAQSGWIGDPRDLSVVPVERPRSASRKKHTPRQLWRVTSPNPDRGPPPPSSVRGTPRTSSPWIRNVTETVTEGRKTILALMGAETSDPAALEAQISQWTPPAVAGDPATLREWQAEQLKQRHRFEHTVAYVGRLMDAANRREPRSPCPDRSTSPVAEPAMYRRIVPVGSPHPIGATDHSGFVSKVRTPFRVFNEIEVRGSVLPPHRRKYLQKLREGPAPKDTPEEPVEPALVPPAPHRAQTEKAGFAGGSGVLERRKLGTSGALRAATTDPSVH